MADNKLEGTMHPVDKGWAWVIMFAAFSVHVFSVGYERSFGLLYVEFQEKFDCSSTLISAIIGTKSISYCFTTVIIMNLALKKISIRTSCMIGCTFQSMSVAISSLITNPVYLILTQGILFGIGHAMLYCPTLFILSQYFHRYRPISTALASCGACVGGIAFPAITRKLLDSFGVSGTLLILGGILFHQMLIVVLYTPPGDYNLIDSADRSSISEGSEKAQDCCTSPEKQKCPLDNINIPHLKASTEKIEDQCTDLNQDNILYRDLAEEEPKVRANTVMSPIESEASTKRNLQVLSYSIGDISNNAGGLKKKSPGSSLLRKALENDCVTHSSLLQLPTKDQHRSKSYEVLRSLISESTNGLNQIHTSMPSMLIQGFTHSSDKLCDGRGDTNRCEDDGTDAGSFKQLKNSSSDVEATTRTRKDSLDFSIPDVMQLSLFWVLLIYFACGVVGTAFPSVYIPPLAQEKGLSREDGAYFLMISASIEIIGRFLPGFILHFQYLRPSQLMLVPATCLGVVFLFTPVFTDFSSLLWLTLAFGLMSSSFWATQTLVVIEVLGLDRLASAIGFYAVFMGLSCSISFPFGGWLRDATGTYSSTFMFLGLMYLIAVTSLVAVQIFTRRRYAEQTTTADGVNGAADTLKDKDDESTDSVSASLMCTDQ